LPASGHAGSTVRLQFRVWSKKGLARELLTVGNGRSVLGKLSVPLRHVTYTHIYGMGWNVPSIESPGSLRFCAVATDKLGKHSPKACSLLKIT
jgi:hypothetical protein